MFKLWATAKTGTATPAVCEPVHVALNKLWAMATAGTKMPVVFELVHAALFKLWATAKTGTAMPVVFEPVHAALNTLWAMAKTGTKILVVFELVHAALFKLWDTAETGTDSAPPVSCHSSEGIRVEDWTPWSPRALSAIAEDAQSGLDAQLNVDPYVRSDQVGPTQPQFMTRSGRAHGC